MTDLATHYSSGTADKMTWKKRLFKKDSTNFMKYIESTTAHGVVRIFTGKSITRRLFWLVIVLVAAGGCLYNISDRISFLVSAPTSTTISLSRRNNVAFPAVTVCNLNRFRLDALQERNLSGFIRSAFVLNELEDCEAALDNFTLSGAIDIPAVEVDYEELTNDTRTVLEDFIVDCYFAGRKCNVTEMFEPVFTSLGICYTFNSGRMKELAVASGTGQRQGLTLFVNVDQFRYSSPIDAGVKIAIHPQSEPPLPDDQGIGIPTGRNAFISIRERRIEDKTGRNCNSKGETSGLNFLQREYTTYSESACLVDCMQTNIADNCDCVAAHSFYSPDASEYTSLHKCTLEDICCVMNELLLPSNCTCSAACSAITYESSVSYSYFPAEYLSQLLGHRFNFSPTIFPTNFLVANVYFETLNVQSETTSFAYSFIALLSDIGGQLGLFLGVSVISIMEFGTWIVDEIKDRIFCTSEKKIKETCSCCTTHCSETKSVQVELENNLEEKGDR